jgi:hypothetical protein
MGRRASKRHDEERARDHRAGDYEGAMHDVRQAMADLDVERRRAESSVALRDAHARLDNALAKAAAAAGDVHVSLFHAAGGLYHAEIDEGVVLWKRRMNNALTLRSKHQLAQVDEVAWLETAPLPSARTRAASGPHQAGLDFASDPGSTT